MEDHKGVLIFGETTAGDISISTTEILGCGRRLANDLNEEVICVLIGLANKKIAEKAISFGADRVYILEGDLFVDYLADVYVPALAQIIQDTKPRIMLIGHTDTGRDLAPRLAFRLGIGLCTDCVELNIDRTDMLLKQTRPVYGGNAMATFVSKSLPQFSSIRAKAMEAMAMDQNREGEIIALRPEIDNTKITTRLLDTVEAEIEGVRLVDAPVIVSGGRGIGGEEGFKDLYALAKLLKGAVGASRPACDSKWIHESSQVGLTGNIVSPDLYIAIGISGAPQHLTGCSGSKTIIAINKDEEADIFNVARFGVVGDWKPILPAFIERIREIVS